ncbi:hypothetical protein MPH_02710 [Macrophomina phaseolina MS6]|uniref:Uncharacterized protein n=1 Tax=Macrophomina phaseolina (strain MS6) TaxID=1126212 RepID=K2STF0_MACPH|nr:hypothetical protein MPH_02710 [Macrophomina phaseolina MS6]
MYICFVQGDDWLTCPASLRRLCFIYPWLERRKADRLCSTSEFIFLCSGLLVFCLCLEGKSTERLRTGNVQNLKMYHRIFELTAVGESVLVRLPVCRNALSIVPQSNRDYGIPFARSQSDGSSHYKACIRKLCLSYSQGWNSV